MRPRPSSALAAALVWAALPAAAAEPTPTITFDEAVSTTLARHPTVAAALDDVRRAEAVLDQVRAAWLPSLTASAAYTHLDDDRVLGDRVLAARDQWAGNLTLAVPLLAPQ